MSTSWRPYPPSNPGSVFLAENVVGIGLRVAVRRHRRSWPELCDYLMGSDGARNLSRIFEYKHLCNTPVVCLEIYDMHFDSSGRPPCLPQRPFSRWRWALAGPLRSLP